MATSPVHYVPLEGIAKVPPRLLAVCGRPGHGCDWSTNPEDVTCSECLVFVALVERLAHDARRPSSASVFP